MGVEEAGCGSVVGWMNGDDSRPKPLSRLVRHGIRHHPSRALAPACSRPCRRCPGHRARPDDGIQGVPCAAQAREPPVPRGRCLGANADRHARLTGGGPRAQGCRRTGHSRQPAREPHGLEPGEDDHRPKRRGQPGRPHRRRALHERGPPGSHADLRARVEERDDPESFILTLRADETLPIVSIDAQAPDAQRAARLANAATTGLRDYLRSVAAAQTYPTRASS